MAIKVWSIRKSLGVYGSMSCEEGASWSKGQRRAEYLQREDGRSRRCRPLTSPVGDLMRMKGLGEFIRCS